MRNFQRTIKNEGRIKGIGLHTGKNAKVKFLPAVINHGIKFQRIDLQDAPIIEADVDYVTTVERGTTITKNDVNISTIEHLLAAVVGLQIDNILIQIDSEEVPILDGSSKEFIECLESCDFMDQDAARNYIEISEKILYKDDENNVEIAAYPHSNYRITCMVDYNSEVLGSQHHTLNKISKFKKEISKARTFCFLHEIEQLHSKNLIKGGDLNNAIVIVDKVLSKRKLDEISKLMGRESVEVKEISKARTFCFLHEIEQLHSKNLIKGGDLNNAIVIVDKVLSKRKLNEISKLMGRESVEVKEEGILNNTKLQYKNEPARHKLLDIVGDLALVGRPIKGHVIAARPGHKSNVEFAKILKKSIKNGNLNAPKYDSSQKPVYGINEIKKILHHRYPFLFVDKITYLDESQVVGIKNVTTNEPFFNGHFPGNPIMPGVLQVEALAQVGGILVMNSINDPENHIPYLAGIEKFRFRKMVIPGDTLIMRCKLLAPIKRGIAKMRVEAFVDNYLVGEGNMTATITKKNNE